MLPNQIKRDYAAGITDNGGGTTDYAGTGEWAQLDLQSVYFGHLSILNSSFYQIMNTSQTSVHQPRQTFSPSLSSPIENDGRQCSETNEDNINPKNNEKKDKIRW